MTITAAEFRRIRDLHGMTQTEFGLALGFDCKWPDRVVRKYEQGAKMFGPVSRCAELLRERLEGAK